MVIFQNSFQNSTWYLIFTLHIQFIHQCLIQDFCHISHIKLEFSPNVKQIYGMELKQKDDLARCPTLVGRLVVKMLSHKLQFSLTCEKMIGEGGGGEECRTPVCRFEDNGLIPHNTHFKGRAEYIIIGKEGWGQLCLQLVFLYGIILAFCGSN